MVGSGKATAAQAAGGHAKISAIFLREHVCCQFGSAKKRVEALIDRKSFRNAVLFMMVCIVPALFLLDEGNAIGAIAIDLVGGHEDKGSFRAMTAASFEKIQSAYSVSLEIVEGDVGSAVMGRLGSSMKDECGSNFFDERFDAITGADIEFVMTKVWNAFLETLLVPASVTLRAEEDRALVVIYAMNLKFMPGKIEANFRTD